MDDSISRHPDPSESDGVTPRPTDSSYSPSSERETVVAQTAQRDDDELRADGIDPSRVVAAPGTGGADDAGDVEPKPGDLNLPWQSEEDPRG